MLIEPIKAEASLERNVNVQNQDNKIIFETCTEAMQMQ